MIPSLQKTSDILKRKIPFNAPKRSSKWTKVRKEHLKKNPRCAACNGINKLNVHHIKPYHLFPELELDPNNLITLCESGEKGLNCHLLMGHLGDYKKINNNVVNDSKIWIMKLNS